MIEIKNLNKKESGKVIFEDLNITISKNEIVGVLGSKGTGKTLLLDIILGIQRPTGGDVIVNGVNVYNNVLKVRKMIGSMANPAIYKTFTVQKFFEMQVKGKKLKDYDDRLKYIISKFELEELMDKNISDLTEAEKKKISVASAYIGELDVILLDDPFKGLDEEDTYMIGKLILGVKEKYITIIASQNPDILEKICDKVIILGKNKGQMVVDISEKEGSLKEIQEEFD